MHAKSETPNEEPNIKRQKTLHGLVKNKSIEEEIAELAIVGGLSFNRIAKGSLFNKF